LYRSFIGIKRPREAVPAFLGSGGTIWYDGKGTEFCWAKEKRLARLIFIIAALGVGVKHFLRFFPIFFAISAKTLGMTR
tara:strand:+ start:504 stop:740 length:237 start_codon:yes stop_codon:yes gene_type:complete